MGVSTEAWGGWYEQDGVRSRISKFTLLITSGDKLSGSGTDDLGDWTWAGESNGAQQVLRKQYVGGKPHNQIVTYTGTRTVADGKELIQGTWNLAAASGPFSLEKLPAARQENYTGYYTQGGVKHDITSAVLFTTSDNNLYGSGVDNVGEFTWTGEIDPTTKAVTLHKQYLNQTSTVDYVGTKSDQAGNPIIQGTWGSNDGDFYLGVVTGPWTGWFEQGGQRYSIIGASLDLTGSSLSGFGTDDIGAFTWEGENLDDGQVVLRKKYVGSDHTIVKTGTRFFQDGKEVIEGTWDNGADSGPFRIETPAGGFGQTGPWTGWFEQGGQRHNIIGASLELTGSSLSGSGTDDFGAFTWEGENLDDGQVVLRKKYVGSDHTIVKSSAATKPASTRAPGSSRTARRLSRGPGIYPTEPTPGRSTSRLRQNRWWASPCPSAPPSTPTHTSASAATAPAT
eukprot:TRINITY_DN130_c0_g1_i2.p1 TRINITY_DN130_c0_g1~~TRINITY_DN130_c0_g1_i2.p1  ORF type:complete len:452 (+),score=22.41 TRINITY_DN130_c0_g1_i2:130-1485(+)